MAYADTKTRSQKLPSIAGVAAVHALIGYAFISGLAYDFVKTVTPVFIVDSIPADPIPPDIKEPPKPQAKRASIDKVTTVTPVIDPILRADDRIVVVVPGDPPLSLDRGIVLPPPQPQASKATAVRARGDRGAWITTEDYPSAAIRGEEEGIVTIAVRIGADGRVGECMVTGSSGHASLDAATCRIYQRRARFSPALDDAGKAVEASYTDRIRWQLPRQ